MSYEHEPHGTGHAPAHHVMPLWVYLAVFFGLMVLTVLTVWVSTIDLGWLNTPLALAIAIAKCLLVILWFMHVLHSSKLTWIVVIVSFLWLALMFVLTFSDYMTRAWTLF